MTDQAPPRVKGYTEQTDDRITLVNELKEAEERYLRILDRLRLMGPSRTEFGGFPAGVDQRCVSEAFTCMQTAAMWAVRAIFQPTRIDLPEDVHVEEEG